jgi:hypothetical protein
MFRSITVLANSKFAYANTAMVINQNMKKNKFSCPIFEANVVKYSKNQWGMMAARMK